KSGKIDGEPLRNIGLESGPKYQDVENNETFEYKGEIYNSKDSNDEAIKEPVVALLGDTMPCENDMIIEHDANIMVHESTDIEGDKSLANSYHHSHIDDVFELMREANVDYSLITHISNRYTKEEVCDISKSLKALSNTPPFSFVSDFD